VREGIGCACLFFFPARLGFRVRTFAEVVLVKGFLSLVFFGGVGIN